MIDAMMASHRVGRLLGIEVRLAYSLHALLAVLVVMQVLSEQWLNALALLLLPVFVLIHELGHSLAALKEGVGVRRIVLMPIGGVAQLEGMIPGPMAEVMIAAAGPFFSLVLASLFFLPSYYLGDSGVVGTMHTFFTELFFINLFLAVFNFIPIFPMDGGRIALAIAVMKAGMERGLKLMRVVSRIGVAVLIAWGIYSILQENWNGMFLIVIGLYLFSKGQQEIQARMYAERYVQGAGYAGTRFPANEPWAQPEWNPQTGFARQEAPTDNWFSRWRQRKHEARARREQEQDAALKAELDRILEKVNREGFANLTPQERDTLNRASEAMRKDSSKG